VELPSTVVTNLGAPAPGQFFLSVNNASQAVLTNTFANGDYLLTLNSAYSNEQVTVNLPGTLPQPPAPQIANFAAAQSVNPAQAFTLTWNPFAGAQATDTVYVVIGNAFSTPQPTVSNGLPGTATSVVIPAGTLQPETNYDCFISFYHLDLQSNSSPPCVTSAYRYAATEFNLTTTNTATIPIVLTNASRSGKTFSFNVTSAPGQSLIVQYTTNIPPLSNLWKTLTTTTNTTGVFTVHDSVNTTNQGVLYRAQVGP
jgi:hypothetical protein